MAHPQVVSRLLALAGTCHLLVFSAAFAVLQAEARGESVPQAQPFVAPAVEAASACLSPDDRLWRTRCYENSRFTVEYLDECGDGSASAATSCVGEQLEAQ